MLFEILRTVLILAIAVPFIYIILDVIVDITRRLLSFYRHAAKPVLVKVTTRNSLRRD